MNINDYKVAVARSVKGKVQEFEFFLFKILDVDIVIQKKHLNREYPIDNELRELNYYFSAYMNSIQSLKDGSSTAMSTNISWSQLSPTYGKFIRFCRNAITHDGTHLINSGRGIHTYISGELQRLDHQRVVKCEPPQKPIAGICVDIAREVLSCLSEFLELNGNLIPELSQGNMRKSLDAIEQMPFIPVEVRQMVKEKSNEIQSALVSMETVDYAKEFKIQILSTQQRVAAIRT
ncbi:hypothetical protein VVYB158_23005 [Vibrio vulnificus CladeA-yb158]|uniref:hypothetical protein n=1 Tax=Vibrio vulnificus TaxID=672 RepID=UPI00063DD0BD|nr:hypothetical protein [Vibrio vulnificus]KLI65461.1 hypothetical protein VVYB158_23005 [Vibrio vulnificus CladeA-yb158]